MSNRDSDNDNHRQPALATSSTATAGSRYDYLQQLLVASKNDPLREGTFGRHRKKIDQEDNSGIWNNGHVGLASALLPSWTGAVLKTCLAATVALYVLNQKHILPKPLSAVVSKTLFWPTLPITVSRRMGKWSTVLDDTVLIGGAPFGFAKYPERLYHEYRVRGVINMCKEYQGPDKHYRRLGIKHLRLPTVDHFEPTVTDLETAVSFIQHYEQKGQKVYVHCRAGHGRSAAVALAWMMYKDPDADPEELNQDFCRLRDVRKTLWRQQNIKEFHARLLQRKHGGTIIEMTDAESDSATATSDDDNYYNHPKEL